MIENLLHNLKIFGLFMLVLGLGACGNNAPAPTVVSTTAPATASTTLATTQAVTTLAATPVSNLTGTVISGTLAPSIVVSGTAVAATAPAFEDSNLAFFYSYPAAKPLTVSQAAETSFIQSAIQSIQTEPGDIKVGFYATADDPAQIFKYFAEQAQAKGFQIPKQDTSIIAVINNQTKEVGQAFIVPPQSLPSLLGIVPGSVSGNVFAVVTGKLAEHRVIPPRVTVIIATPGGSPPVILATPTSTK